MKRGILIIAVLITFFGQAKAQQPKITLSEEAQISILSSDPGTFLFEAFGHSSMRIFDAKNNVNWVYNYGMFNFFQENFYINFIRGYMRYHLGVVPYPSVKQRYERRGIPVRELVLNLSLEEKQQIFDLLQENRKEENKYYYYDYFYDNCATRFRDILEDVLADKLVFENPNPDSVESIRSLMKQYLGKHQWGEFGIDLGLGSKIDKPASYRESMYLPEYLEEAFQHAKVKRGNRSEALVLSKNLVVNPVVKAEPTPAPFSPIATLWTLFGVGALISLVDFFRRRTSRWFDFPFFLLLGLTGLILSFLWFFTNHVTAGENYNMIWAFPLHFFFSFMLLWCRKTKATKNYALFSAITSGLLMFTWGIVPQDLHYALVPVVLLIFIRSLLIYIESNRQLEKDKFANRSILSSISTN